MRSVIIGIVACLLINISSVFAGNDGLPGSSVEVTYEKAISSLKKGILENPDDMVSHQTLAQLYLMNDNFGEAIAEANWILVKDPKSLFALSVLMSGYMGMDQYDKSIEAGKRMLLIEDRIASVYNMMGENYKSKKEYEKAIEYYSKGINLAPTDMVARNNLCICYLKVDNIPKALSVTLESVNIDKENSFALYILARVYARKGDSENAINWLKKAIAKKDKFKDEAKRESDFSKLQKLKEYQELIVQ